MKVVHVTTSVTASGGGLAQAVVSLNGALRTHGVSSEAVALKDGGQPLVDSGAAGVHLCRPLLRGLPWSPDARRHLLAARPEVVHSHGLWAMPSVVVPGAAGRLKVPWIVSPHGMLDAWALRNSRAKKALFARLFENGHLRGASCLQALCRSEAEAIRSFGLRNPIALIPNGVDLPESRATMEHELNLLLFLGRLHPKKGLMDAVKGWKQLVASGAARDWAFVIAGWDQDGHALELRNLAADLGLRSVATIEAASGGDLIFPGPVYGAEKADILRRASGFILPSYSEGLPIAVLEAWAAGLPAIITPECNVPEGIPAGAAIGIQAGGDRPGAVGAALRELMTLTREARLSMGNSGCELVRNAFAWGRVADAMAALYRWLGGGGERPGCVEIS